MTRREEIEQATMQVGGVHPDWDALECFRVGYKEGAKWADKTMIEKACKWLINIDFDDFHFRDCDETFNNDLFVDAFHKAMEE
jgi:hypothetical protein